MLIVNRYSLQTVNLLNFVDQEFVQAVRPKNIEYFMRIRRPFSWPPVAASTSMTSEQKINQLNKLAAGGYITPEEYKAKKQAILNSL